MAMFFPFKKLKRIQGAFDPHPAFFEHMGVNHGGRKAGVATDDL